MGNSQGSYAIDSKQAIDENKNEEDNALGIESCAIPAACITASSSTNDSPAFFARLNGSKSWCAGSPADSFLEVDLDTVHHVSGVATQGNPSGNHDYVKNYKIQYSTDGIDWDFYKENYKEVLEGNTNHDTAVRRKLDPNIKARYVRFWPTAWFQWPCLRVEIYGRPAPPEKMTENGVVTIKVDAEEKRPSYEESEKTNEEDSEDEKEVAGPEVNMEFLNDIDSVTLDEEQEANDVEVTQEDEDFFTTLDTSTPASTRVPHPNDDVNNVPRVNNDEVLALEHNDVDLKRLMEVKTKLEFEAEARKGQDEGQIRKNIKKRVTLEDEPPEYFHLPRRIYNDMWGDSPTGSLSEGIDMDEKPLIEIQDGGAPLAKHEDDVIEEGTDQQQTHSVTIRTVKTITTRLERHVGHENDKHDHDVHDHDVHDHDVHEHDVHEHVHDHEDSPVICPVSTNVSHNAPDDFLMLLNGFYDSTPYAAQASCEHLHPTDPAVQVAMESSFSERVDSMDQINIDALASRRFSGLDLLQSPYDAVSGEDIERLLAWEDDTLPGWTRIKKSRDYEIFKGTAVDGGPPIIKAVITLKKIAYEEAVRRITDWEIRKEWDKTFDKITFIEQSYNFNVLHCAMKKQGLTLAVLDDVDIDEPYHASVWSVADHPHSYPLSPGKPLRYETMISGLVVRPTQDGFPSSRVTVLCQVKGSVSPSLKGTYLTGNPDRWIDMLKKYSSQKKSK